MSKKDIRKKYKRASNIGNWLKRYFAKRTIKRKWGKYSREIQSLDDDEMGVVNKNFWDWL